MCRGAIAEGLVNKLNWGIMAVVYPPWKKGAFMFEDAPTLKSCAYDMKMFINHACNGINVEQLFGLSQLIYLLLQYHHVLDRHIQCKIYHKTKN
jgi:hypothetical protein